MPLTRNGKKLLIYNLFPVANYSTNRGSDRKLISKANIARYIKSGDAIANNTMGPVTHRDPGTNQNYVWESAVAIGDGTDEFSLDDYKLSNSTHEQLLNKENSGSYPVYSSNFSNSWVYATYLGEGSHDNKMFGRMMFGGTNLGTDPLTITEIGLFIRNVFTYDGINSENGYSQGGHYFLIYREVLPEPIIVPAGEQWLKMLKIEI